MSDAPSYLRRFTLAGLVVASASCSLWHRGTSDETQLAACPAPASSSWAWQKAGLSDATIELPSTFVEHRTGDTRSRSWQDGRREIELTLTSDPHVTRDVSHFVGRCAMEVGERTIEVVETNPSGSTRQLLALVPQVEGGPSLLVRVSTPYAKEIDVLRRTVSSVRIEEYRSER